jgi:hypothetical protein
MNGLGHYLFSRATLALDQNRDISLGDFIDDRFDLIHLGTVRKKEAVNIFHNKWVFSNLHAIKRIYFLNA